MAKQASTTSKTIARPHVMPATERKTRISTLIRVHNRHRFILALAQVDSKIEEAQICLASALIEQAKPWLEQARKLIEEFNANYIED